MNRTKELLEAALSYQKKGWSVFPVNAQTKRPLIEWKSYQKDIAGPEQIKQWWTKYPYAGIGLVTGKISNLIVLDIDGEEGKKYIKDKGIAPTPCVKTKRGEHYYFKHPGVPTQNFAKKKGLDLRGDGGYVVLPPSKHPSGVKYEWMLSPEEELADPPDWLLELITFKEPGKKLPETELSKLLDGVITGKRHDTATRLAGHYIGKGLASNEVLKLLKLWNEKNKPPLPESELIRMVEDFSLAREKAKKTAKENEKIHYHLEKVIVRADDFLKIETPQKKTILSPWLKEKQIILISGWRGVGKSLISLGIIDAVTRKQPFGPWNIENPVNCLYLDAEMVKADLDERLLDINSKQEREAELFIYSSELASILKDYRPRLDFFDWQRLIEEYLLEKEIKVWVADNIASLTPGVEENAKAEWDFINQWLLTLRFKGITTILIHHLGKLGTQRGTSAREDNIDISIMLDYPVGYKDTDGCKFNMRFTKTRLKLSELQDISDLQFQLIEDEKGNSVWTYTSIKGETTKEVLIRLDEGQTQKSIAEELDITEGYVSRIKNKAQENKLLDSKKKLTGKGKKEIEKNE